MKEKLYKKGLVKKDHALRRVCLAVSCFTVAAGSILVPITLSMEAETNQLYQVNQKEKTEVVSAVEEVELEFDE